MRTYTWCSVLLSVALAMACGGAATPRGTTGQSTGKTTTPTAHADTAGVRDGHVKLVAPDGWLQMEGDMKDGLRTGLWTSYTREGRVKSRSEYRNGEPEGIATVFHANGALYYTGSQRKGRQVGEWRYFDEQGQLVRTVQYDTSGAVINNLGHDR